METREFIKALPKAEVHLHLEGAVPLHMIRAHSVDALPEKPLTYAIIVEHLCNKIREDRIPALEFRLA